MVSVSAGTRGYTAISVLESRDQRTSLNDLNAVHTTRLDWRNCALIPLLYSLTTYPFVVA